MQSDCLAVAVRFWFLCEVQSMVTDQKLLPMKTQQIDALEP